MRGGGERRVHGDPEQPALGRAVDAQVQHRVRLDGSPGHAADPAVQPLQHEEVRGPDEGHGGEAAEPARDEPHLERGVPHALGRRRRRSERRHDDRQRGGQRARCVAGPGERGRRLAVAPARPQSPTSTVTPAGAASGR